MRREREREREMSPLDGLRKGINLFLLAATVAAGGIWPLLRRPGTFGQRFIGWEMWCGVILLGLMPAVIGAFGPPNQPTWPAELLACMSGGLLLLHFCTRDRSGQFHSMYCGRSGLPGGQAAYTLTEPVVVMGAGVACLYLSVGLGIWLMVAGACSVFVHDHMHSRDKAKVRAMRDARHEQEAVMDLYRAGGAA